MALKPCRECGSQVSASAATCPSCGVKRPVKRTSLFTWSVTALFVLGLVSFATSRDAATATGSDVATPSRSAQTASPRDSTPGIARVGRERAAKIWRDVPTTPGMRSRSCDYETCQVMFDPSLWTRMPYDQKRDFVAMMGIAFAYGEHARWTEIHDMLTNKRLGRYSTNRDDVDID